MTIEEEKTTTTTTTPSWQPPAVYAVAVLVLGHIDSKGTVGAVGVARKNNPNSFGLVGGKVEPTDPSPEAAAIRECREESGLILKNPVEVYRRNYDDKGVVITYMGNVEGEPQTQPNEPECRWCSFNELLAGKFGEYNVDVFKKLKLI